MFRPVTTQLPACRGVGPRALSNGINSAVFFVFFEALRAAFARHKEQVGHGDDTVGQAPARCSGHRGHSVAALSPTGESSADRAQYLLSSQLCSASAAWHVYAAMHWEMLSRLPIQ